MCYLRLSNFLGDDQPFYGLQAPGVDGIRQPLITVDAMAREYVDAIRQVQPQGPYYLAGWSAGGVIAYDIAQKLLAAGQQVAHLGIIDSGVLYTMGILKAISTDSGPGIFELMGREPSQNVAEFRRRSSAAKIIPDEANDEMAIRIMQLFENNVRAICYYSPKTYPGRLDLYQAAEQLVPSRRQPSSEWKQLCEETRVHIVPGNHLTVVHEPNVQELAAELKRTMLQP